MDRNNLFFKIKKGDKLAFKSVFELYYHSIYTYLISFTRDVSVAQDIAQNTFVVLWEKRETINIKSSLKSYLFKIAYNLYVQNYRDKKAYDKVLNELTFDALNNNFIEEDDYLSQKIKLLKVIIKKLPPQSRKILELKQKGIRNNVIAEQLNLSVKTIESHIYLSFKKIRNDFEEDNLFFILITYFKNNLFCNLK